MKLQLRGSSRGKLSTPVYRFNITQSFQKVSPVYDFQTQLHSTPDYDEKTNKEFVEVNGDSFHRSIAGTLAMARIMFLFPITGIFGTPRDLKFKARSVLSIISALATLPSLWVAITAAVYAIKTLSRAKSDTSGSVVNKMAGCIFYLNAWVSAMLLRGISKGWSDLQNRWRFEELRANVVKAPPLKFKLSLTAIILMTLALVNYNTFLGVIIVLTSEVATFTWNFQDLFLIQISMALCTRFKHINSILDTLDIQNTQPSDWRSIRELYCGGLELTRQAAALLAPLVLLSFSNNLFFICLQMFNGLSPTFHDLIYKIYFFGSFGFMVGRVTSVALSAASIPLESKKHVSLLRCCPSSSYCHEIHRLCQQLVHDEVSLSGMGFFTVNRNFMLGVMGAIATYEIVLLQMV